MDRIHAVSLFPSIPTGSLDEFKHILSELKTLTETAPCRSVGSPPSPKTEQAPRSESPGPLDGAQVVTALHGATIRSLTKVGHLHIDSSDWSNSRTVAALALLTSLGRVGSARVRTRRSNAMYSTGSSRFRAEIVRPGGRETR